MAHGTARPSASCALTAATHASASAAESLIHSGRETAEPRFGKVLSDGTGRANVRRQTVFSSQNGSRATARLRNFVGAGDRPWGRRIRILRIITRLNTGGPAVYLSTLCRGLSSSRYEQWLVTGVEGPGERSMLPFVESQGIRPIRAAQVFAAPKYPASTCPW
jgi:hypothetical protein